MLHRDERIDRQADGNLSRRVFFGDAARRGIAAGAFAMTAVGTGASDGLLGQKAEAAQSSAVSADDSPFKTRGVVLVPGDMATLDWPQMAKQAGLTTIGTHITPSQVSGFICSERGQIFLNRCHQLGLHVEHELHAMSELLPRKLFKKDPSMFPMNDQGDRVADYNLCVHSKAAMEIVCENAVKFSKILRSDTGRYFYWLDDWKPMCRCPKCKGLSDTDQSLIVENAMVKALQDFDDRATLAHLAYNRTLVAPTQIKPRPGIFLEFAPVGKYDDAIQGPAELKAKRKQQVQMHLDFLDANLKVFDLATAQVLEYWLDESLYWRDAQKVNKTVERVKIPWYQKDFEEDLAEYGKRGIRHITTFAVMIDDKYETQFGPSPLKEYGAGLKNWRPS